MISSRPTGTLLLASLCCRRQYEWTAPGSPKNTAYDGSRDKWQPHVGDQFHDPPSDVDTGVRPTLEMVVAAIAAERP